MDVMPLFGIVGGMEAVIGLADAVEIELLFRPVSGAYTVGALEHDVLKVVGDTCGGGLLVLATSMDYHTAIYLGLGVFFAKDYFQTIV